MGAHCVLGLDEFVVVFAKGVASCKLQVAGVSGVFRGFGLLKILIHSDDYKLQIS